MSEKTAPEPGSLSRRRALQWGSAAAGGLLVASLTSVADAGVAQAATSGEGATAAGETPNRLPVSSIEKIIGAQGDVSDGVLSIEVDRTDIGTVRNSFGVPIKPAFQVNGNFYFQSLGDRDGDADDRRGAAAFNGDMAFLEHEIQPAIDQMLKHGLIFQAFHQHFYDWHPMVWFMHMRAFGDPLAIARGIRAVLNVTSTPLPQKPPSHPTTPLDTKRLARIIGETPTVGDEGVVDFEVPRKDRIILDGVRINPHLNVASTVSFEPLGSRTAVVVDFGMTAPEVQPVTKLMRSMGWQIGCLYNQETAEQPQLYFEHQFKAGDPYQLAAEVRKGLDLLNT